MSHPCYGLPIGLIRHQSPVQSRSAARGLDFLRVVCLGVMVREEDLAKRIGDKKAKALKQMLSELRASYRKRPPDVARFVAKLRSRLGASATPKA